MILFWMPEYLGSHPAVWRQAATRDLELDFDLLLQQVQTAERGKLHGVFVPDTLAVGYYVTDIGTQALSYTAKGSRWEPVTLLSSLAASTRNIGLLGTVNATYSEPYNVARMLASLDHISDGRAGWHLDYTSYPNAALNFGREDSDNVVRQSRCEEFLTVVNGLWDSWEDDAFVRDKDSGVYFEPSKLHALNHRGEHFSVAGPLNIARPLQGHPVLVQTGSSIQGTENADIVCPWLPGVELGKKFYDAVKAQAAEQGRHPEHVKILPAIILSVGHSRAHAEQKLARLDDLVDPVLGLELLARTLQLDLSGYDLDSPVPEIAAGQGSPNPAQQYYLDIARRDKMTIRQLMQTVARVSVMPGCATDIADMMQEWIVAGAADGFAITFDDDASSLEIFVDKVVPELQRRGLFRNDYRSGTLRENLGLPRPANCFAKGA